MTGRIASILHRHPAGRRTKLGRRLFAALFLASAATHVLLLAVGVDYEPFASAAYLDFVRDTWTSLVAPRTYLFIPLLIAFEAATGLLLLSSDRRMILGLWAAIAFHVGLMFFNFGIWLWSIPMLVMLARLVRASLRELRWTGMPSTRRRAA